MSKDKTMLDLFKRDANAFAQLMCGYKLLPFQKDFVEDNNRKICLVAGRRVGKSLGIAIKAVRKAYCYPNQRVMIIAKGESQAEIIFEWIRKFMVYNPVLYDATDKVTMTKVAFKNGSTVRMHAAGQKGEYLRGFEASMLIIDEAAYVPEDVMMAVEPVLMTRKDGQIILSGTPSGKEGRFWKAQNDKNFSKYHMTSVDSPYCDDEWIEDYRGGHTDTDYRREILAEFVDYEQSWFDHEKIRDLPRKPKMQEPKHVDWDYYLGVDFADEGGSENAIVIVGKYKWDNEAPLRIINYWYRSRIRVTEAIRWVRDKCLDWRPKRVICDSTGLGLSAKQQLEELVPNVEGVRFQKSDLRFELYYNMKKMIEDNKIIMIDDRKLIEQFHNYTVKYTQSRKVNVAKGINTDGTDALAMACLGAMHYVGVNVEYAPEISVDDVVNI